jgi:hypothetical protein
MSKVTNNDSKTFYKIIDKKMIHYNFEYKEGVNVLKEKFICNNSCLGGGLYFCNAEDIVDWIYLHEDGLVWEVTIPPMTNVYTQFKKYKADKIIINNPKSIEAFIEEHKLQLQAVNCSGMYIRYIKPESQTFDVCMLAIKKVPSALKYIVNQTPEICLEAFKKGCNFGYIRCQTPEICLEAVKMDWQLIGSIKYQTREVCLIALEKSWIALKYIRDQTDELCLRAVQNKERNGYALAYVKKQTPEICMEAVKNNGMSLEYVLEQTPEICMMAVEENGLALQYVNERTIIIENEDLTVEHLVVQQPYEVCVTAVRNNGLALQYVKEQTKEICKIAINNNELALEFVKISLE